MTRSLFSAAIAVLFLSLAAGASVFAASGDIVTVTVSGAISPGTADFVISSIDEAEAEKAACLIVLLDTPGGLVDAMRDIVMRIMASRVPVVVYVFPGGARAASAGVMITMAADIAAMAPGTNIGAAHPVGAGGTDIDDTMGEKITNDMVAHARSVAEKRGRNADWVERSIRESASITETEALSANVINVVADDLADLIKQIDGMEISGKGVLRTKDAAIRQIQEGLRSKILRTISDPNIAYILMMIGLAGLYFELSHPGAIFPGVVGGISLILAFFAFQTLPVSTAGILLIVLSLIFFIMEMKITSYGLLSVAGIVALLLGSMMLYEGEDTGVRLSMQVLVPTVTVISLFFSAVAALVFRAHLRQPASGAEGIVGEIGVVKQALAPEGKVLVHGELWWATSDAPLAEGVKVRVTAVDRLKLTVEPV
ncbi:MAG: nodulation protein NfeD [Pseudomonadota bacterium]